MDPPTSHRLPRLALGIAAVLACSWAGKTMHDRKRAINSDRNWVASPMPSLPPSTAVEPITRTIADGATPSVHSATAIVTPDGGLRAFWFGGSREGAADVSIWTSILAPGGSHWSSPEVSLQREQVSRALGRHIRKLGNPVASVDPDGTAHLFVVSVSLGGWSGSTINHLTSPDSGQSWTSARRLIASPFFNLSTLVKGPPLNRGNHLLLPAYHEMVETFPQFLSISTDGHVIGRTAVPQSGGLLQPWPVAGADAESTAFLRHWKYREAAIYKTSSTDGGNTWSSPAPTNLPNPNASIAALRADDGGILIAYNDSTGNRKTLSLAWSPDGTSDWKKVFDVDTGKRQEDEKEIERIEYSYPWLLWGADGSAHLFYTWNRVEIRHLQLSPSVLQQLIEKGGGNG